MKWSCNTRYGRNAAFSELQSREIAKCQAKSGDLQISMITSAYKYLYRKRLISSSSMFEGESCCDVLWCMRKVRGSLATALESLKFVLDCLKIVGSPGGDRCWPARFALVKLVFHQNQRVASSGDEWLVTRCRKMNKVS